MREEVMDSEEIRQLNDYALSKWVNELQIMNAELMCGSPTVRVRLFNTYGPGEYYTPYRSAISIFAYKALHDLPYTVYPATGEPPCISKTVPSVWQILLRTFEGVRFTTWRGRRFMT